MPVICLNCGTEVHDRFCPHCGQKKEVKKLTWHSFFEEIFHFFSHIEHGFLNTTYQLLIRPGRVINEYLQGKREKYHKPVSLFLIWAAIRLLTFKLIANLKDYKNFRTGNSFFGSKEAGLFVVEHNQVFGLLLVPIIGYFVWLIISRKKMNYIETMASTIYLSAGIEVLIFFQIFITGLLFQTNFLTNGFVTRVEIIYSLWALYAVIDIFKKDKIKFLALRAIFSMIISFLVFQVLSAQIADLILKLKH